jgi:hypothetical protein
MSYLGGFLGLAFGVALLLGAGLGSPPSEAFGRPRVPPSRIASISASRYKPAGPTYRKGLIPFRSSRLLTAPEDIPSLWAISSTVRISLSIYYNIYDNYPQNQSSYVKNSLHIDNFTKNVNQTVYFDKNRKNVGYLDILLYRCIAKTKKFAKIFVRPLTIPLGAGTFIV